MGEVEGLDKERGFATPAWYKLRQSLSVERWTFLITDVDTHPLSDCAI
jgi:hypothetical protein